MKRLPTDPPPHAFYVYALYTASTAAQASHSLGGTVVQLTRRAWQAQCGGYGIRHDRETPAAVAIAILRGAQAALNSHAQWCHRMRLVIGTPCLHCTDGTHRKKYTRNKTVPCPSCEGTAYGEVLVDTTVPGDRNADGFPVRNWPGGAHAQT